MSSRTLRCGDFGDVRPRQTDASLPTSSCGSRRVPARTALQLGCIFATLYHLFKSGSFRATGSREALTFLSLGHFSRPSRHGGREGREGRGSTLAVTPAGPGSPPGGCPPHSLHFA